MFEHSVSVDVLGPAHVLLSVLRAHGTMIERYSMIIPTLIRYPFLVYFEPSTTRHVAIAVVALRT